MRDGIHDRLREYACLRVRAHDDDEQQQRQQNEAVGRNGGDASNGGCRPYGRHRARSRQYGGLAVHDTPEAAFVTVTERPLAVVNWIVLPVQAFCAGSEKTAPRSPASAA